MRDGAPGHIARGALRSGAVSRSIEFTPWVSRVTILARPAVLSIGNHRGCREFHRHKRSRPLMKLSVIAFLGLPVLRSSAFSLSEKSPATPIRLSPRKKGLPRDAGPFKRGTGQ